VHGLNEVHWLEAKNELINLISRASNDSVDNRNGQPWAIFHELSSRESLFSRLTELEEFVLQRGTDTGSRLRIFGGGVELGEWGAVSMPEHKREKPNMEKSKTGKAVLRKFKATAEQVQRVMLNRDPLALLTPQDKMRYANQFVVVERSIDNPEKVKIIASAKTSAEATRTSQKLSNQSPVKNPQASLKIVFVAPPKERSVALPYTPE